MEDKKKKCVACKEAIWSDASICPHCQTPQNKQLHKTILLTLKELSAVTVVITLIFAMVELNRFADSWFEDSSYANRLAASASMLLETGEFTGARQLLQEAKKVYPASEEVGAAQKQLAMISIREIGYPQNPKEEQIVKDSLYSLYHNLGGSDKNDANVLAHIAWAIDTLREKGYESVDMNQYLDRALVLDESSVYANVYKGFWYIERSRNKKNHLSLTEAEVTVKAQQHFKVALQQNIDSDYVRKLQVWALNSYYEPEPAQEYVKLVLSMYAKNDKYYLAHRKNLLSRLYRQFSTAIGNAAKNNDVYMKKVFLSLSEPEIESLNELFNLNPNDDSRAISAKLLLASISESKGEYLRAIDGFISVYKMVKSSTSSFLYDTAKLVKKACSRSGKLGDDARARCDEFFIDIVHPRHFRS